MATRYSPKITTDGLQICMNFSNTRCYPAAGGTNLTNLINADRNNGYIKNSVAKSTPFGNSDVVVLTGAGGNGSGGTNAVGDRIDINTSASGIDRFGAHSFSFEFWLKWISGTGRIFSTGSAGTGTGNSDNCIWQFFMDRGRFYWWNSSGGGANNIICDFTDLVSGVWTHVVITFDYNNGGNNILKAYQNGALDTTSTVATATHSFKSRADQTNLQYTLCGGYSSSCYTSNTNTSFGAFNCYNKTLTANEVLNNFRALKGKFEL